MRVIGSFYTTQCDVAIYDTDIQIDKIKVYMIKSYHRETRKVLTRFGTKAQIDSIVKTYRIDRRFKL